MNAVIALIGLRGRRRGGKRIRGERYLVAAALSKIGAGMVLLVRKVGVALLVCFFSGRRDMCVCCLCLAGAFTLSKSDAFPQYIISEVSLPLRLLVVPCVFPRDLHIVYW